MKVFISGGCKNGKSMFGQRVAKKLAGDGPLYYVATMIPSDDEDIARIKRHLTERDGMGFTTIECGRDILNALDGADTDGTFLLDSVTALLMNEISDSDYGSKCAGELAEFARRVKNVVFVSDFIYSDAAEYDEFTEKFREALALCDRTLASLCDSVVEVSATNKTYYKGVEWE